MSTAIDRLRESLQRAAEREGLSLPTLAGHGDSILLLQAARQAGLNESIIAQSLAETLAIEQRSHLRDHPASASFVEAIPINFARRHGVLGLASDNGCMPVAVRDPAGVQALEVVSRYLDKPVKPVMVPDSHLNAAINIAYQQRSGQTEQLLETLDDESKDVIDEVKQLEGREDLLDIDTRAPVIKLVNLLLFDAVKENASDIHIQPREEKIVVRKRIDGILFNTHELPINLKEEIASRIKVMGKMNIAEKRLPQDGRSTVQVGDRLIDLRISSIPTSFGERMVIRLLDKSARLYTLDELGMTAGILSSFNELIHVEHGLILVTGPTGSGKSTTLYAALQQINSSERNILTLEDPIEYQLDDISQTQVSTKKGMTFASGLRSVLRQDPDIIMVGEIRDHETAVMAIQSALTGHLVFSTLHTNDAASAVTRLLDLGIEPYLAASSLIGVLAQRLVRRLCSDCASPYSDVDPNNLERIDLSPDTIANHHVKQLVGCDNCRQTGYRGRIGLFELLTVDDTLRRHINARHTAADIKMAAVQNGMKTLRDEGKQKVLKGITSIDEVVRVTMRATPGSPAPGSSPGSSLGSSPGSSSATES